MKYITSIISGIGLGLILAIMVLPRQGKTGESFSGKVLGENQQILPTPTIAFGIPTKLEIPKLGINTQIEKVGMTDDGAMDVPKKSEDAAWYQLGPAPGNMGSAVLAGHYDWYDGPSIFYNLGKLTPGDEIITTDSFGKKVKFKVTETKIFEDASFPIDEVFSKFDKRRLNLITCNGTFDRSKENYDKRLVVFSEKVD